MKNKKIILDACCGGRMFWYNKKHPNVMYIDKRVREKGFFGLRPNFEVQPDIVADFRDLPFDDNSFKLVVFDPPHIIRESDEEDAYFKKRYGCLRKDSWESDIKKGFSECFRVLEDYGTLIFKWSELSVKLKDVVALSPVEPLFGHKHGSRLKNHWLCFMKIPNHH